jgi:hypothetical protein
MASVKVKKPKTEKPQKPQKNLMDSLLMPDGTMIDLNSFDWGKDKLNERQKLFVVWFSMPGTEYYHCAMKAARKAGYTPKTANVNAGKLRRDPVLSKLIKQFEDTIGKIHILDAAERFIHEKIVRGDYDVKDFYETIEYTNPKTGASERKMVLKNLDDLTHEQRLCIDDIDVKGQKGIMIYTLPDREKIRDSLIAIARKDNIEKDEEEYDIETVEEIIKGKIEIKIKVINRNKEIMDKAEGFVKTPKNVIEEE